MKLTFVHEQNKQNKLNPVLWIIFSFFSIYANAQDLTKLSYVEIDKMTNTLESTGNSAGCIPYMQAGRDKAKAEFGDLDSVYAVYTSNLGYFYQMIGHYKKAEPLYLEIITLWTKILGEEHPGIAEAKNNLAMLYKDMGNYEKAEPLLLESKDIWAKVLGVEHPEFAQCLSNLALFYQEAGQYDKAEPLCLQAKNIWAKSLGENHPYYATSLNNLAGLYQEMGSYDKAETLFLQAKSLRAAILGEEHPSFGLTLNNLAMLYKNQGLYEKAEPLFLQSQGIVVKVLGKEHPRFAASLNNLGQLYQAKKDYSKAEKLFLEAKNVTAKVLGTQHPVFASKLNNLAMLYKAMGLYEKAESLFLQGINIELKTLGKEHVNYSRGLNNLAGLYLVMGKLDAAFSYCIKGIDANSAEIDSNFVRWETLDEFNYYSNQYSSASMEMLLEIYQAQYAKTKDKTKLEAHYQVAKAAMRFNERIRNDFSSDGDKLRSLDLNNFFVLQGISAGIELGKEGYAQEAFDFAELNKGILLMDAAKTANAYKFGDLPDSLLIQEKELQKEHDALKAALLENLSKQEEDSLAAVLNKVKLNIDAFTKKLKTQYPKYAAIKYEDKTAKATEIQALLDDETALLEYVIGDAAIYIFYVDKQKVKLTSKPLSDKILAAKIKDFHTTLSNYKLLATDPKAAYLQYTENAYWFYENLVAPAIPTKDLGAGKSAKGISKLIIVADGELGHLPFETFLTKVAPQKETDYNQLSYLLNDYKISYNYSATLWKEEKEKKHRSNNGQILGMTANYDMQLDSNKLDWRLPAYQRLREGLLSLPAAKREMEILAETFTGFFGFDKNASEKIFKEKAGDYAVIHLAMHGLLDAKNPILSSLAFTEDGDSLENNFLHAYEISKMKLNADLVVLSACETGYGRFDKGNGIASLAQAFAYAGAPAMIVSLWQVNDYATSEIMKNLYHNLANGMEKDEALQQAKIQYMKNAKGVLAHPAFWSPFIQMGNTDAIYLKTNGGYFWWLVGGVLLALVGGAVVMRSRRKE